MPPCRERCHSIDYSCAERGMVVWSLNNVVAYLERSEGFLALTWSGNALLRQSRRCSEEASCHKVRKSSMTVCCCFVRCSVWCNWHYIGCCYWGIACSQIHLYMAHKALIGMPTWCAGKPLCKVRISFACSCLCEGCTRRIGGLYLLVTDRSHAMFGR